jgi:two-component sensor histidine kinase
MRMVCRLVLEIALVQPLALIIHELAVNAAVHGALSKSGGRLICLSLLVAQS